MTPGTPRPPRRSYLTLERGAATAQLIKDTADEHELFIARVTHDPDQTFLLSLAIPGRRLS